MKPEAIVPCIAGDEADCAPFHLDEIDVGHCILATEPDTPITAAADV
jgi:hypothetical protein